MRGLTTGPIRKRYLPKALARYLTKQPPVVKIKVACIGGPFDGYEIELNDEGPYLSTAEFAVPSYNNGERGRYVSCTECRNSVTWVRLYG